MKPQIRFKTYIGDWESKELYKISKKVTNKNVKKEYNITLTNSAELGIINQLEYFDHEITNQSNIAGYYIVENNDFVYNPRISSTAPVGPINRNTLGYTGVMSPLYYIFRVNGIDENYLSYFFKTRLWHRFMFENGNTGARFDRLSISDNVFNLMPISFPNCNYEQKQIADFFLNVDSLIEILSKRLSGFNQIKSACLQSLFPQDGELVPKVRFKGFEGEWKKDRLSKFVGRITRKNKNLECNLPLTISSTEGLVSQLLYFNNIVAGANLKEYYLIKKGEFAYNKSYSNGYPFGSVKRLDKYEMGVLSTLYIVFGFKDNSSLVDSDYLATFFSTTLWHHQVSERAEEGARNHGLLNIGANDFLDINITFPKDLAEQKKISDFFMNLEQQILNLTQRLEKFKHIKASCLDKMFV